MAEVRIAALAGHRNAPHAEADIRTFQDIVFRDRLPEARPTGAGFELGAGVEQDRLATDAIIQSFGVLVPQCTGKRPLGSGPSSDVERLGGQLLPPLRLAPDDLG
jgi:hypothetical protein